MKDLQTLQWQAQTLLKSFGSKNIHSHFIAFSTAKTTLKEKKALRQELVKKIKNYTTNEIDESALFQIGKKPECSIASISISHCNNLGAFVFTFDTKLSIGFDIEEHNRITDRVVERVSSKKEVQLSPSPALLWTAKEAGLKCFSDGKTPFLLSDIFISNWKQKSFPLIKPSMFNKNSRLTNEDTKLLQKELLLNSQNRFYSFKAFSKKQNKEAVGFASLIENLALAWVETTS